MPFNSTKSSCKNCSRKAPLFDLLSEKEVELIDQNRTELNYKAGEVIYKQGTTITHIISFNCGLAKVYLATEGREEIRQKILYDNAARLLGLPHA